MGVDHPAHPCEVDSAVQHGSDRFQSHLVQVVLAAQAQRKATEIAEDAARKADPSVAPLLEKMHKAFEARRPESEAQGGRKLAQ